MKTKNEISIKGISFKRYQEHDIMRHSIELHINGEIPDSGLSTREIRKLLKKY